MEEGDFIINPRERPIVSGNDADRLMQKIEKNNSVKERLAQALREMKDIRAGKVKAKTWKELYE